MLDAAELVDEIDWWLGILRGANRQHQELPGEIRADIEAGACPRELGRMITHMADMSTSTRRRVEDVLVSLRSRLLADITPPAEHVTGLRVVGRAAG